MLLFTMIIGYRHSEDRLNNLNRTLQWATGLSSIEIIVVEQDSHSKISHLSLPCKHIFVKNDQEYNRSWAFNVGLRHSTTNIICFNDSDLIMEYDQMIKALEILHKGEYEMISPYSKVIDLTEAESFLDYDSIVKIDREGRGETDNQQINICGGLSLFSKEAILRIAGWNEDFRDWGGEDDFQTMKVTRYLKHGVMKGNIYHLYHKRAPLKQHLYNNNIDILKKCSTMNEQQFANYVNSSAHRIGLANKYN